MRWASAHSQRVPAADAARDALDAARAELGEGPVDLALLFLGAPLVAEAHAIANVVREAAAPGCLIGVSAHGVINREHEVEQGGALTVMLARMPGVTLSPFVLMSETWNEVAGDAHVFSQVAPGVAGAEFVMLFGDPFSLDVERVLLGCNRHAPGVRAVGGMASAGARPRSNVLLLNDWIANEGGVGLAFGGALRADVVVSQGCRPVGPPLEVTRSSQNIVLELDGQPALERIEQMLQALPEREQSGLQRGLYVGRPVRDGEEGRGAYLIRNLLGADRERGAIAIGDLVRERERLRLHVRDARAAREDLELLLSPQAFDTRASGAILFACTGRGTGLYGAPDGDVALLRDALGEGVPMGGMFCAGEIGPVGARNYLHGHTASIAVLRGATEVTA